MSEATTDDIGYSAGVGGEGPDTTVDPAAVLGAAILTPEQAKKLLAGNLLTIGDYVLRILRVEAVGPSEWANGFGIQFIHQIESGPEAPPDGGYSPLVLTYYVVRNEGTKEALGFQRMDQERAAKEMAACGVQFTGNTNWLQAAKACEGVALIASHSHRLEKDKETKKVIKGGRKFPNWDNFRPLAG